MFGATKIFLTAVCMTTGSIASAQSINPCDWVASARNLVEPWNKTSRTYANGAIRIALLDTGGEPACCSNHLLVLSPDPEIGQACHVLSEQPGLGFGAVYLENIQSGYDPEQGLLLDIPVGYYDPNTGRVSPENTETVPLVINQATGLVSFPRGISSVGDRAKNK